MQVNKPRKKAIFPLSPGSKEHKCRSGFFIPFKTHVFRMSLTFFLHGGLRFSVGVLTSVELKMVQGVSEMHHSALYNRNLAYLHEKNRDSGPAREGVASPGLYPWFSMQRLTDFDFHLPEGHIALTPAVPRDHARLLHVKAGGFGHNHMYDLPGLLRPGDLLVVNDSRVIPARLYGKRGLAKVEILLHRNLGESTWEVFARPAKRLKPGQEIMFAPGFEARVEVVKEDGLVHLAFAQQGAAFEALLRQHGQVPLPPYIRRKVQAEDQKDYQTIYARQAGSVAAPTAGLHFTETLLEKLKEHGVGLARLTLHVGGGTFLPVKTENLDEHVMHPEAGAVPADIAETINATRAKGGRIVAVGTTSCRLLETAANDDGRMKEWHGETRIFIRPGYRFKAVDALLTNFHLPKSTLFMLVSAFAGTDRMKAAYAEAIRQNYRFYSYGDGCLLERNLFPF